MRQVSRFLDDMMRDATKEQIDRGLPLPNEFSGNHGQKPSTGRLYFQTRQLANVLPDSLPGTGNDKRHPRADTGPAERATRSPCDLVSKDINLRIKAAVLGVHAEDYYSDKTLEDTDVLYSGMTALPADFWEKHGKDMRSWKEGNRTFYEISGPAVREWQPNQGVYEGQRRGHRRHRPQDRRRYRHYRAASGLPERAAQSLGHHGA